MKNNEHVHIPLFKIAKRNEVTLKQNILFRGVMIFAAIIVAVILSLLVIKKPIGSIFKAFFEGVFLSPDKMLLDAAMLLGFGIAVVPAFRMKYWNMGANGQVYVGALVCVVLLFYMGDFGARSAFNNFTLIFIAFCASIVASVIWAVIPAVFKAFFDTNETLFTLMMNYIAIALLNYVNYVMAKGTKESIGVVNAKTQVGWLPELFGNEYILPILVVIGLTVFVYFYMSKTKHGYEAIVCGDSMNTARYVGMNTKKITIRTLVLSGVITGILGFLYACGIGHCVSEATGGVGFTAVLLAWLSNFNPIIMAVMSLFLSILTMGTSKVSSKFRLGSNNLSNVIIGLIFFAILISEFFIRYTIKLNSRKRNKKEVSE